MKMHMLRGAIFDMDGVLVDSHPTHMRAWRRFFQSMGKSVSEQQMEFIHEGRKRGDILSYFLGDLSEEQIRRYGQQKDILFAEEMQTISTIAGVRELLEELAGASISMAVASCGSDKRVNYLLDVLELRKYFPVVVTGDDVTQGKPDPTIFRIARERIGVSKDDALCFEDSVSGVVAAKAAGMKCIGITDCARKDELIRAGADTVFPNFHSASVTELKMLFDKSPAISA